MREEFNNAADERDALKKEVAALKKEIEGEPYSSDPAKCGLRWRAEYFQKMWRWARDLAAQCDGSQYHGTDCSTGLSTPYHHAVAKEWLPDCDCGANIILGEEFYKLSGYGVKLD
jgi:hypothetical protein